MAKKPKSEQPLQPSTTRYNLEKARRLVLKLEAEVAACDAAEARDTDTINNVASAALVDAVVVESAGHPDAPQSDVAPALTVEDTQSSLSPSSTADALEPRRKQGERLSPAEIQLVLRLRNDGMLQSQIAQRLGCTQPTICRLLEEWAPTEILAKATLQKGANTLAEKVVNGANVEEAMEALHRMDVLPKRDEGKDDRVQVFVGVKLTPEMGQ